MSHREGIFTMNNLYIKDWLDAPEPTTRREPLISSSLRWPIILLITLGRRKEQKLWGDLPQGAWRHVLGGTKGPNYVDTIATSKALPSSEKLNPYLGIWLCFLTISKSFSGQFLLGSHQKRGYFALFTMTFYFIGMQNKDLLLKHRFVREKIYCTHAQRNSIAWKNTCWQMT